MKWFPVLILLLITASCIYLPAGSSSIGGAAPTITSFSASPTSINAGEVATLSWSVTGATSVTIDQGIGSVAVSGTRAVSPTANTVYTLTAGNGVSSSTATTSVFIKGSSGGTAPPDTSGTPVINSYTASPPIVLPGGSSSLSWDVYGATSVSISPGVGVVGLTGSVSVTPATSIAYVLTATNSAGSTVATTTVLVQAGSAVSPPIIMSFTANPANILSGSTSTISWNVYGASSLSIDPGIGAVGPAGSRIVSPTVDTTYTLTATNSAGNVIATTDVNVSTLLLQLPVIQYFTANPSTIFKGASTTLAWQTTSATKVTLNGVQVTTNGAKVVSPAVNTDYKLIASNAFGSKSKTITITVLLLNPNLFKPIQVIPLGP